MAPASALHNGQLTAQTHAGNTGGRGTITGSVHQEFWERPYVGADGIAVPSPRKHRKSSCRGRQDLEELSPDQIRILAQLPFETVKAAMNHPPTSVGDQRTADIKEQLKNIDHTFRLVGNRLNIELCRQEARADVRQWQKEVKEITDRAGLLTEAPTPLVEQLDTLNTTLDSIIRDGGLVAAGGLAGAGMLLLNPFGLAGAGTAAIGTAVGAGITAGVTMFGRTGNLLGEAKKLKPYADQGTEDWARPTIPEELQLQGDELRRLGRTMAEGLQQQPKMWEPAFQPGWDITE